MPALAPSFSDSVEPGSRMTATSKGAQLPFGDGLDQVGVLCKDRVGRNESRSEIETAEDASIRPRRGNHHGDRTYQRRPARQEEQSLRRAAAIGQRPRRPNEFEGRG